MLGRLSSASAEGVASVFYSYDPFGSVRAERWLHDGETAAWTTRPVTSAGGLAMSVGYETPSGETQTDYKYDSAGRVRSVLFGGEGREVRDVFTAQSIDPLGRYRKVLYGNGAIEAFQYSDRGYRQLVDWNVRAGNGSLDRTYVTRDALGRATKVDETLRVGSTTNSDEQWYSYDTLGRLKLQLISGNAPVFRSYGYDALGNRTSTFDYYSQAGSRSFVADTTDPDRLCYIGPLGSSGPCNVTYDGGGDVRSAQSTEGDGRAFIYDSAQRLVSMKRGAAREGLTYGPGGALVREAVADNGTTRDIRHYGGLLRHETSSVSGDFDERVIMGPLGAIATARNKKKGDAPSLFYVHGDAQANRLFTDDAGTIAQYAQYDAFGSVRGGNGTPGSITYTGNLWNGGTAADPFQVDLLGARSYDPSLGRFLQRDALTFGASASYAHPYAFSWSDPVNHADPSGMMPFAWISSGYSPSVVSAIPAIGSGVAILDYLGHVFGFFGGGGGGHANGPHYGSSQAVGPLPPNYDPWVNVLTSAEYEALVKRRVLIALSTSLAREFDRVEHVAKEVGNRAVGGLQVVTAGAAFVEGWAACSNPISCGIILGLSSDVGGGGLDRMFGGSGTTAVGQFGGKTAQLAEEASVGAVAFVGGFARPRIAPATVVAGAPVAARGTALEGANFAQKTYGSMFSRGGAFAGRSVDDVAGALRSGAMSPSEVPINYIVRDGNTLILNTRSAQALEAAGIPRSAWNAVNRTGQEVFENMLTGQLQRNGLTSAGTATVRRSGGM